MRVAAGMSPAQAARAEGLPGDEAEALLARPDFGRLVQDFRDLAALGREERLARLEALAFDVLEDAIGAGDVRVVLWFLTERHAGRDPVRRVAEAVVRQAERAGAVPTPRPASPPAPSPDRPPPRPVREAPRGLRPPRPRPCGRRGGRPRRRAPGGLARPPGPRRAPGGLRHRGRAVPRAGGAPALVAPRLVRGAESAGGDPPGRLVARSSRATTRRGDSVEPAGLSPRWPMVA